MSPRRVIHVLKSGLAVCGAGRPEGWLADELWVPFNGWAGDHEDICPPCRTVMEAPRELTGPEIDRLLDAQHGARGHQGRTLVPVPRDELEAAIRDLHSIEPAADGNLPEAIRANNDAVRAIKRVATELERFLDAPTAPGGWPL